MDMPEDNALPFPHTIGDPNVDNSEHPEAPQPTAAEQQLAEMRALIEQQNQAFAQREQFYQQQLDTLMQQRAAPAQAAPTPAPLPSLDDLPDPLQNPTNYNRVLAERIAAREAALVQNVSQNVLSEVTRATALDSLWNRFNGQHTELAKKQTLLQGAAAVTFNELRARGLDPVAVAAQNPDSLISAIATRMQAELGAAPGTPGAQPATGGAARTMGLSGGSTATPGPAPQQPKIPSFHQQHLKAQADLGLI